MNGEMLEELRAMAQEPGNKIPTAAFRRLMLACMDDQLTRSREIQTELTTLTRRVETICDNPSYRLGEAFKKNPKLMVGAVVFFLLVLVGDLTILTGFDLTGLIKLLMP